MIDLIARLVYSEQLERLERLLGRLLGIGARLSAALLSAGLVLSLATGASAATPLLHAGLLTLLGTPALRVVVSCVEFVRERDWLFASITFVVLLILAASVGAALRG